MASGRQGRWHSCATCSAAICIRAASSRPRSPLLNTFTLDLLPGVFATVLVMAVDLGTGACEAVAAGHPIPFLTTGAATAAMAPVEVSPPLGIPGVHYTADTFELTPGATLVLYSDGLIEHKGEDIDAGMGRILATLSPAMVRHHRQTGSMRPPTTMDATTSPSSRCTATELRSG